MYRRKWPQVHCPYTPLQRYKRPLFVGWLILKGNHQQGRSQPHSLHSLPCCTGRLTQARNTNATRPFGQISTTWHTRVHRKQNFARGSFEKSTKNPYKTTYTNLSRPRSASVGPYVLFQMPAGLRVCGMC